MLEETTTSESAASDGQTTETPDYTPETLAEAEDADESVDDLIEKPTEDAPESDESEESVTVDAEVTVEEDDWEDSVIPSPERIDKLRIPKEDRTKLKALAALAEKSTTALEELGGDFGITTFTPLAKAMTKPSMTDQESQDVMTALVTANPGVTMQLLEEGAYFILTNKDIAETVADPLLRTIFGEEKATIKHIKRLLDFDRRGLTQGYEDDDRQDDRYNDLTEEVTRLKQELKESKTHVAPDLRGERAAKDFETDFYVEIPNKLKPAFERENWDAGGTLAKLVTEVLQFRLRDDQKYKDTDEFVRRLGEYRNGEHRHGLADANLHLLKNKALAQGRELIRTIQGEMRTQSEKGRNRIIAQKQQTAQVKKATPQPLPAANESFEVRQNRIRQEYLALADA